MKTETDHYLPTRASLLSRLRDWDDHQSWSDFFERYWKMIFRVARRAGLSETEAQDVVQETIITVAKKLPEFKYDPSVGSFKGWLLTITRSKIQDHIRKKHYHRGGRQFRREEALSTSLLESQAAQDPVRYAQLSHGVDLEGLWDEEWRQNVMEQAIARVKAAVPAKQYQLFDCHGLKGLPARQVAAELQVSLAQVYIAKYRVSKLLRKEIKALEQAGGPYPCRARKKRRAAVGVFV